MVANTILPLVPAQVEGLVAVAAKIVGNVGLISVFMVASVPVQPLLTMVKLLYEPAASPVKIKALLLTVTVFGVSVPVNVRE